MTFKMKNMKYWKAKNNIPGINNDFEKGNNLPDGRSTSSPFQKNEKKDPYTKEDEDFLKAQREEKVHGIVLSLSTYCWFFLRYAETLPSLVSSSVA